MSTKNHGPAFNYADTGFKLVIAYIFVFLGIIMIPAFIVLGLSAEESGEMYIDLGIALALTYAIWGFHGFAKNAVSEGAFKLVFYDNHLEMQNLRNNNKVVKYMPYTDIGRVHIQKLPDLPTKNAKTGRAVAMISSRERKGLLFNTLTLKSEKFEIESDFKAFAQEIKKKAPADARVASYL